MSSPNSTSFEMTFMTTQFSNNMNNFIQVSRTKIIPKCLSIGIRKTNSQSPKKLRNKFVRNRSFRRHLRLKSKLKFLLSRKLFWKGPTWKTLQTLFKWILLNRQKTSLRKTKRIASRWYIIQKEFQLHCKALEIRKLGERVWKFWAAETQKIKAYFLIPKLFLKMLEVVSQT